MGRGGYNLEYEEGFQHEEKHLFKYDFQIKQILNAEYIESATRTIVDRACGIDLYATIDNDIYGVSLRVRSSDFKTCTLSRHVSDPYSEINKWTKQGEGIIKPAYHVQINEGIGYFTITRINIVKMATHLSHLVNIGQLENYYNSGLFAYEFKLTELQGIYAETTRIETETEWWNHI